ncbi:MAG: HdeD family acid-resistance protein [Mycobacterium sp.]
MATLTAPTLLPHLWKSTLISGVLAILLGIAIVVWPGISILVAAIFFGAYLLITGIAQVVLAFSLRAPTGSKVLLFVSGLAAAVLGVLCFLSLQESIVLLAIWIGIGFIFRGIATAASAISDKTLPGRAFEIFFGVISVIAGIVMMVMPFESLATLALVVGIWLIVTGVFEIAMAFGIRKESKVLSG